MSQERPRNRTLFLVLAGWLTLSCFAVLILSAEEGITSTASTMRIVFEAGMVVALVGLKLDFGRKGAADRIVDLAFWPGLVSGIGLLAMRLF